MKKNYLKMALVAVMLCSGIKANAQLNLGNILNQVANTQTSTTDLISNLTSVFSSSKQASSSNIVGTWVYEEPAIVFQSDNLLTKAAAKIAAKKLESKLQTQLSKIGIKPGTMQFTFKDDGTFTEVLGKHTNSGKWAIQDSKLVLTYNFRTVSMTTQVDGNELLFVTDSSKLLNLFKSFGNNSANTSVQTITSLMKSVKGMQAGVALKKK